MTNARVCRRIFCSGILILVAHAVFAQPASALMDISITIGPILMLQVDNSFETIDQSVTQSGDGLMLARGTYGVTCVAADGVIYSTAASAVPDGVEVSVRMHSSIGTSLGWRTISAEQRTVVVDNVHGAEHGILDVRVVTREGVDPTGTPIVIAYTIEDRATY